MTVSQNGWLANTPAVTKSWAIPGTSRRVTLQNGNAGYLLVHFAAWFHIHVELIDVGEYDDWGYAERMVRGSLTTVSNHASGTALDLNASKHPLGKVGTFSAAQTQMIREQLKVYEGAIRWGGDYTGRKDEMHFEINASPTTVTRVATKLRNGELLDTPDGGFLMALSNSQQETLAAQVDYLHKQLTQPFTSWRYDGKQENLTVVDYLRGIDRELRTRFTLDNRPAGKDDTLVGQILSVRAVLDQILAAAQNETKG